MSALAVLGGCEVPVVARIALDLLELCLLAVVDGVGLDSSLEVLDELLGTQANLVRTAIDVVLPSLDLGLDVLMALAAIAVDQILVVERADPMVAVYAVPSEAYLAAIWQSLQS